jgi:hypothetical protein
VNTVTGRADAELANLGRYRSEGHLPLLTNPLEGGQGSGCRMCRGHANNDPLRGLAAG